MAPSDVFAAEVCAPNELIAALMDNSVAPPGQQGGGGDGTSKNFTYHLASNIDQLLAKQ